RIKETRFLWEGPRLLAEFNGYRSQIYAYGDQNSFAPLARIDGGGDDSQIYYYHNQVNGQPEAMTDREGNECWRGESDSFGKVTGETRAQRIMSGGPQNLRMQGQYLDRETGLHYNLHRYYDPDSGRFTQADPIGLAGGLNLYQYAPNVLGWVDPWGLSCGTIKANSRNEALNRAQQHAQVPRISRGGQDISLNDLNPTSRGDNWGKMKADGAQKLGRRNPNGKNSRFEHPDGHPADAGKPDIPDHHSNGHVHAINTKGEEVIFTW
ncbi:RHS repeat-associated core domain-containing protein, partial [Rahnella woolbedingensis]